MANLKEVRERIKTVNSTQQITKAMKMVSAAKLRKATQAIVEIRPYSTKLDDILFHIIENLEEGAVSSYGQIREMRTPCIVVITSNRGLCGAFNSNVIKVAEKLIQEKYENFRKSGRLTIICIGKKGYDYFRKNYKNCKVLDDHVGLFSDLSYDNVAQVSEKLISRFKDDRYQAVEVAYGRFKNAGVQYPEAIQLLPVQNVEDLKSEEKGKLKADYIFEPNQKVLLEQLIPSILQVKFLKCLLDTQASEHGARMTAMDKATENANEMLKELKINYNKARQEAITNELSEIVGGAAALSDA